MKERLHTYGQNKVYRDKRDYICVGNRKICRYLPESDTLQFQLSSSRNDKRLVEIEKNEFIERLTEVLT